MSKVKTYTEQQMDLLIERLIPWYERHIEASIDWKQVEKDFADTDLQEEQEDGIKHSSYLGSVFTIMPSGKYWTFWANSNVDQREQIKDTAFMEALESVASERGMWIESGEGDACDLFICRWSEIIENEDDDKVLDND